MDAFADETAWVVDMLLSVHQEARILVSVCGVLQQVLLVLRTVTILGLLCVQNDTPVR